MTGLDETENESLFQVLLPPLRRLIGYTLQKCLSFLMTFSSWVVIKKFKVGNLYTQDKVHFCNGS